MSKEYIGFRYVERHRGDPKPFSSFIVTMQFVGIAAYAIGLAARGIGERIIEKIKPPPKEVA